MKGSQIPFKKNYILGCSIILSAIALGVMMILTVRTLKSFDDTVTVRGLCEKEVPADRVVYRISYSLKSNDLSEIRNTLRKNNEEIISMLRKAGLDDDEIKTGTASYDDRYLYSSVVTNISYRYTAQQTITIFTQKLDLIRKIQQSLEDDLAAHDILASSYADYQFLGLNDIKPSMIAESLENARTAATEFAKNSHSRIGKMRTASQGYFEVDNLDENTPQIKKVRVVTTVTYYLK